MSLLLLKGDINERDTFAVRAIRRLYTPALRLAVANRALTLGIAAVLAVVTIFAARGLGIEFLPKLEEGNMWIRATMPTAISLEAGTPPVDAMRALMKRFPEVQTVVSQHDRPDDGTDATGFFNAEFFVPLKPASEWPSGTTKEKLTQQMQHALEDRFPGVEFNFSQRSRTMSRRPRRASKARIRSRSSAPIYRLWKPPPIASARPWPRSPASPTWPC